MNIWLLAENWAPRVGGIENYLMNIAARLPEKSVTVITPATSAGDIAGRGIKEIRRYHFFWPVVKPRWLPLFIKLYRRAKKERPDMLFCGKALFEGLVGFYLKKHLGIPYVVFTYAMEIEVWSKRRGTKRKLGRVLRNADRVVYINEVTKKKLLELGVTEKQLVKIWPGIEDEFFKEVKEEEIKKIFGEYRVSQPYVLSVARLIERKGIDVLIEAFSKLDQTKFSAYKLVIVGNGPLKQKLQAMAEQDFIKTSVVFLDDVPSSDLPALYSGAELFVLTPKPVAGDIEGFGIVYLEAAAQGVPSIASDNGGAPEAVLSAKTGLVVPAGSADALSQAVAALLSNKEKRNQFGSAAKERAWNEFRWSKRILLVKGVVDALLAERVLRDRKA